MPTMRLDLTVHTMVPIKPILTRTPTDWGKTENRKRVGLNCAILACRRGDGNQMHVIGHQAEAQEADVGVGQVVEEKTWRRSTPR
jgi:hypothetical protein